MKRFVCISILLLFAIPAWPAKMITVGQLEDMLKTMQQQKKGDADVAAALKEVQLTEELTRQRMNSLVDLVQGPLSTEQIYVLEARSAMLSPPPSDIPTTPAPDPTGQKSILDKAATYVTKTYAQLPALTAVKTTLRFQDNVEAAPSTAMHWSSGDVSDRSGAANAYQYVHYINATESTITSEHGVEKLPSEKDKTPWGANRMIALQEPDPSLEMAFQEAQEAGTVKWLRWELINGKPAAVFAFEVAKKKSHLALNVCCFPELDQTGGAHFTGRLGTTAPGPSSSTPSGSGGKGMSNFQSNADWHNFKSNGAPYHGEFFIDPDSGTVVRMIIQTELKPSDLVHKVDTRIDYLPVKAGDMPLVLPQKTVVNTEVVPNGDSGAGHYTTRCTLFTTEYKDYQLTGKTAQK